MRFEAGRQREPAHSTARASAFGSAIGPVPLALAYAHIALNGLNPTAWNALGGRGLRACPIGE